MHWLEYSQKHASEPHVCTRYCSPRLSSSYFRETGSVKNKTSRWISSYCLIYIDTLLIISIYTFSAITIEFYILSPGTRDHLCLFFRSVAINTGTSSRTQRDLPLIRCQLFTGWAVSAGRDLCTVSWRDFADEARNEWTNDRAS